LINSVVPYLDGYGISRNLSKSRLPRMVYGIMFSGIFQSTSLDASCALSMFGIVFYKQSAGGEKLELV
jgi:hypothetical protein